MAKIIFLLIVLCSLWKLTGGNAEQPPYAFEEVRTGTSDGVIVPRDRAGEFYYGSKAQGYFTPLKKDVLKAEGAVVDYIEGHTPQFKGYPYVPDLDKNLADYKRQYVGVVIEGKRKIWLNFFCRTDSIDWKRYPYRVFGGGGCYFHVLYDIDSAAFSELWINGLDIQIEPAAGNLSGNMTGQ